jgi:predicted RNA polymerase sigma factor
MRHPIAELISNSIIDEECDDDRFRLLYAICHFYNSTKYNKYICVKVYNYN